MTLKKIFFNLDLKDIELEIEIFWIKTLKKRLGSKKGQVLFLEFSKDGSADLGDEFMVVVRPTRQSYCKVTPVARCLGIIASFNPTSKGFLKLVADFLMQWCMCSSMR